MAFDIYQAVTDRIISQLEAGTIPWRKPWVCTGQPSNMAISHSTGNPYSLLNQMLLGKPGEYLTFNQCAKAGGKVKSLPTRGEWIEIPEPQPEQSRDAQGRFTKKADSEVAQYAQRLVDQAAVIHDATGVDVMALYNNDPDVKQKINSREWTFADVYKHAAQGNKRPAAPAPVRSSNGVALGDMNIARMSKSQLEKLDELLAQGVKIDMR